MIEPLINFETAKLAKEKGCDLPLYILEDHNNGADILCTQSLLQKWLREKHDIHIYVDTTPTFDSIHPKKWRASIKYCFQPFKWTTGKYVIKDTYEEVLETGLQEALKLIK